MNWARVARYGIIGGLLVAVVAELIGIVNDAPGQRSATFSDMVRDKAKNAPMMWLIAHLALFLWYLIHIFDREEVWAGWSETRYTTRKC